MANGYRGEITEIEIKNFPETTESFIGLRDKLAGTPEGGVAVFVLALIKYAENEGLGEKFLTMATDAKWLTDDPAGYKGKNLGVRYRQGLKMRIIGKPYVARSYVQGTSPENDYQFQTPFKIKFLEQESDRALNEKRRSENGLVKLFVYSTGTDRPRPIQVNQNNRGIWKAYNWGSLEAGVRLPGEIFDDEI
jgi:hypothetical protein